MPSQPIETLAHMLTSRVLDKATDEALEAKKRQLREYVQGLQPSPTRRTMERYHKELFTTDTTTK